jgi:hypothetical protein
LVLHHATLEIFSRAWLRPIVLTGCIVRRRDIDRPLFVTDASGDEAAKSEGAEQPLHVCAPGDALP